MKFEKEMENAHILFNMGDFFTKEIKNKNYSILFNDELPTDTYLNYATKISVKNNIEKFIDKTEKKFRKHKSIPAFYIMPNTAKTLENSLLKRGYSIFSTDAWMIPTKSIESKINARLLRKEELEDFIRVYIEVFTKGEKDDPYHDMSPLLGEFLHRRLTTRHKCKTEAFAAFIGNNLIGTVCLIYNNKYACVYSLAVLPEYRNKGAARSLLSKCVERTKELKVKLFLQTVKGSRNEKIFKKLGFKTIFIGKYLYKP